MDLSAETRYTSIFTRSILIIWTIPPSKMKTFSVVRSTSPRSCHCL